MPLVMMVVIVGVAIFALNKWNPAAAAPVDATAVDATAVTEEEPASETGTCEEGTQCSCSKCCGGKGCKGGKDKAKRTGGTESDGKCTCKCEDGCSGASGGSSGGGGGSSSKKINVPGLKVQPGTKSISKFKPKTAAPKPAGKTALRPPLFGGAYARAYNVSASNPSVMRRDSRMIVEVANDNNDYLPYPKAYLTYGQESTRILRL